MIQLKKYVRFSKPHQEYAMIAGVIVLIFVPALVFGTNITATEYRSATADDPERFIPLPEFNRADYDARLLALAHVDPSATSSPHGWPVKTVYPEVGAIMPFKRIVAYYGNFYSTKMGVLGEYPESTVLAMLASTTAKWAAADPTTPTLPAIQYIAVVAQNTAGREGKYILRM